MVSRRAMPSAQTIGADAVDVEDPRGRDAQSEAQEAPLKETAERPDCILRWCRCISAVDVLVLLAATVACMASMITGNHQLAVMGLKGTSVAFCWILIAEQLTRKSSWCPCAILRQFFPLLDYWVGRGLLHLFIALQMEGMNDMERDADEGVKTFVETSSLALLAMGGFFTAGAFLCFGPLERRQQRLATRKEEVMRELTDLERRKKALETEAGL
mmetsp:Transcript_40893/g.85326  ORF Transcript_40893/g.85326 Transcript_40893/m.85326 type:complete len:215 (-) Transcript_40893:12-656(-)